MTHPSFWHVAVPASPSRLCRFWTDLRGTCATVYKYLENSESCQLVLVVVALGRLGSIRPGWQHIIGLRVAAPRNECQAVDGVIGGLVARLISPSHTVPRTNRPQ